MRWFLVALTVSVVAADEPTKVVAVVVTGAVNLESAAADRIGETLGEALRDELDLEIVAGESASRVADDLGTACMVDPECLLQLGKRFGADELLLISLVRIGDKVTVDPHWMSMATGRSIPRSQLTISVDASDLREVVAAHKMDLLPGTRKALQTKPNHRDQTGDQASQTVAMVLGSK